MTALSTGNPMLDALLLHLPAGLKQHLARARDKALELAAIHNVDPLKARLAAVSHDIVRGMEEAELLGRVRSHELARHPVEGRVTILLHGPVGVEMLQRECGIKDSEVLEAVRWHSTFNRGLGHVANIAYLADKLDHQKAGRYPQLEVSDRLARDDLTAAILSLLQQNLVAMIEAVQLIHTASVEGRNELLELRTRV